MLLSRLEAGGQKQAYALLRSRVCLCYRAHRFQHLSYWPDGGARGGGNLVPGGDMLGLRRIQVPEV